MPEDDHIDEPLTELEQDQQDTGWFFFLALPEAYPALSGYVDESRGYPIGVLKPPPCAVYHQPRISKWLTTTVVV